VPRWPANGSGWLVQVEETERGISGEDVKWMQFSPWKGLVESPGWYQCDREVTTGLAKGCVVLRKTDVPTTWSTIILHGSTSQKTTLNITLAVVRT
jgi:hypothetical protein